MSLGQLGLVSQGAVGGGGGGTLPTKNKDVVFYDYDGSVLYSYTSKEAQSLTELPTPPTHDRLTFDKWTCSLEEVKSAGKINVGALYYTTSGQIEFAVTTDYRNQVVTLPFRNGAVNWGDGITDNSNSHTYETAGEYIVLAGFLEIIPGRTSYGLLPSFITKVFFPKGVKTLSSYAFYSLFILQSVVIPDGVTSIGNYAFQGCYSLQSVVIPDGVTSIGNSAFYNCYSLQSVVIPDGVTSIGNSAFHNCYSLQSVVIPDGVTSIGNSAFQGNLSKSNVQSIILAATIPPTLESTNAFISSAKFYVSSQSIWTDTETQPEDPENYYNTATNWATFADRFFPIESD